MSKRVPSLLSNIVAGLALLGYLTAALGLPLPVPASPTETEMPVEVKLEMKVCGCVVSDCESACCCCGPKTVEVEPVLDVSMVLVLSEQFRKCHGLETLWLSVGLAISMPPAASVSSDLPLTGMVSQTSRSIPSLSSCPVAPPPRG